MEHNTINRTKVKEAIKERGLSTSDSLFTAVMEDLHKKLKKACERASENGRKTVYGKDYQIKWQKKK